MDCRLQNDGDLRAPRTDRESDGLTASGRDLRQPRSDSPPRRSERNNDRGGDRGAARGGDRPYNQGDSNDLRDRRNRPDRPVRGGGRERDRDEPPRARERVKDAAERPAGVDLREWLKSKGGVEKGDQPDAPRSKKSDVRGTEREKRRERGGDPVGERDRSNDW